MGPLKWSRDHLNEYSRSCNQFIGEINKSKMSCKSFVLFVTEIVGFTTN